MITSPADGVISQAGEISKNRILQAKNVDYSLARLVGDSKQAKQYENGIFSTIYLSPKDYHGYIPADGQLLSTDTSLVNYFQNQQTAETVQSICSQ